MIRQQLNRLFSQLDIYEVGGGGKCLHFVKFVVNALFHGASADDYFRYRLWEKSQYEISKFITYRRSKSLIRKYNNPEMIPTLRDKTIFNKFFHENIGRNWLCTDLCSLEDFVEFVKKYKRVICKPLNGGQGQGIFIYEYSNDKDAKQTFDSIPGFLVEELIVQHSVLSSINPTSVNTCRIVTFTYNGVAHIIACSLRTGVKGAVVDNLHSNTSQCWSIDIDSGIVFTPSCGYDYNHWLKHIGSGVQVIGMKIPNWEVAKSIVIKSAQKIPEIGYIGWDVAITEGGACLIEANHDPGHDLMQMIDQVGKYQYIKKIINQST